MHILLGARLVICVAGFVRPPFLPSLLPAPPEPPCEPAVSYSPCHLARGVSQEQIQEEDQEIEASKQLLQDFQGQMEEAVAKLPSEDQDAEMR